MTTKEVKELHAQIDQLEDKLQDFSENMRASLADFREELIKLISEHNKSVEEIWQK